jgi:O-antigen/teichoic acid export membrane protein
VLEFKNKLKNNKELLTDTFYLALGQGGKLGIQAIYFVLIARSLGPASYGGFVALTAMTNIIAPFIGLGTSNLFIKNYRAGRRSAKVCWGNGVLVVLVTGVVCSVLVLACNQLIHLQASSWDILMIAVSDLIFMRITDLAMFGFAADGNMKQTAFQGFLISLLRLIAIAVLAWKYGAVSFDQWIVGYALTGILAALYAIWKAFQQWGIPQIDLKAIREDIAEGVFFSISTSAQSIYNDIDKTMLGKLSTLADTGIYGAAYRFIDVSMTPVRSLVSAAYPRFFKIGEEEGLPGTWKYAKRLISKSMLMGVAIFLGFMLLAPAIPYVLGHKYDAVVPAVRWLALIPFLRCIHSFLADSLSGANQQMLRTLIQIGIAVVNILLNFWILPRWSWRGAAWTSIASDALLVVSLWIAIQVIMRRPRAVCKAA